jgi:NAD(P)-dependent dehydrogenase (short-subunit alcohol dehydrogenase family)
MLPEGTFEGRTAIVTGGGSGLGRAIALELGRLSASVVVAGRRPDPLAETVALIEGRGGRALAQPTDVREPEAVDGLVAAAVEQFGRVDVLVNNAGMSPVYPEPAAVSEELWDKVVGVNLKGPFRLIALVGPRMAEQGGGSIINVSSTASLHPRPDVIPYAAAKAGVNALTQAFAHAWPAVRVNCIVPGPFLTDISKAWDMEAIETRLARFALRRAGRPDEIIGAALYLASDAAAYTTGALLSVDGGYVG